MMSPPTATNPAPPSTGPQVQTRQQFMEEARAWILARIAPGAEIGPDTPLFEGLIDSIRILELIAWTERALDRRIPDRMIRMDHFRTLRALAVTFIEEEPHVDG